MVNNNLLAIVVVAVVVALVASFATASIVGNTINVDSQKKGTEVYTKAEIDKKLSDLQNGINSQINKSMIFSNQGVLNMLNKCAYYGVILKQGQSCDTICANPSIIGQGGSPGTCVNAEFAYNDNSDYKSQLLRCSFSEVGRKLTCVCCNR